jgi:hypothetical protein
VYVQKKSPLGALSDVEGALAAILEPLAVFVAVEEAAEGAMINGLGKLSFRREELEYIVSYGVQG